MIPHVPTVFGHELAGMVTAVGAGVRHLREGDHVVAANSAPCGECRLCVAGRPNLCEHLLFVNGAYFGLYTIVESVDKAFLKKNFGENDGHLYEFAFDTASEIPFNFGYPGTDAALYAPVMEGHPSAAGQMLIALDFHLGPVAEVALVWPAGDDAGSLVGTAFQGYRPNRLVVGSATGSSAARRSMSALD